MSLPLLLQSMCLKQATRSTCPRHQWLTTIPTPRHAACYSPGTFNTIRPPLNRERGPMPGLYATLLDWLVHFPAVFSLFLVCSINLTCCVHFPCFFYFLYASRPHVTIPICTPSLVSLFTDEGSWRLPKRLIYFLLIWLVCCKTIIILSFDYCVITYDCHVTIMWLSCDYHVTAIWLLCDYHVNYTINRLTLATPCWRKEDAESLPGRLACVHVFTCVYSMCVWVGERKRGRGGGKWVNQQTGTHHDACGHSTTVDWFKSRHIYHTAYVHTYTNTHHTTFIPLTLHNICMHTT